MSEERPSGGGRLALRDGWQLAGTRPDACAGPTALDGLHWRPAVVPGTVAGALGADPDVDGHDWWYRVGFAAEPAQPGEEVVLGLEGLATVAEVYLNGEPLLTSESMFAAHVVDVGGRLRGENELAICFRALAPRLAGRRKPRARWRTRLVASANLRFYRTMLLGRAPGFAPGPAVAGPWRPIWLERRSGLVLDRVHVRARLRGDAGIIRCAAGVRALAGAAVPDTLRLAVGSHHEVDLRVAPGAGGVVAVDGEATVAEAEPWWPHTHGSPALYPVALAAGEQPLHHCRVGFRRLETPADLVADGPALRVNGVDVFARGVVWTPPSLRDPHGDPAAVRAALEAVASAGMNIVRVPGIGAYESDAFYDACDELGILVWQDFMFANLDYPEADPAFMALVADEARELLDRLGHRPAPAIFCGGSEVAQQVAMLGLDPALAEGPLYGELLPEAVREAEIEAPYVPSTPWGGELPFRTDRGVANYYGVGAYLRPLEDARRAEVRFAGESLAFANVPDEPALAPLSGHGAVSVYGPAWKAGTPRDPGAGWDFDDVRDHYLRLLYGVDPAALRFTDPPRFLELSRAVTGEVMAETFGEWRRTGSPCAGALVLWLRDLRPGAGWGIVDDRGELKLVYRHLARALAPVAVWTTDEGLGGIDVHVANDRPAPLSAQLRVALYRDGAQLVEEASTPISVGGHGAWRGNVEGVLGHFVDVSWAYRFGPAAQDLIVVSLQRDDELLSQAFRFPLGRPSGVRALAEVGLSARLSRLAGGRLAVTVRSDRYAHGVRIRVPGWRPSDDGFGVEPGHPRTVVLALASDGSPSGTPTGVVTALNVAGTVALERDW